MQWDDSQNASFTTGTPWIKVNPNYPKINAAQAIAEPESIFHYYRQLIRLRKANAVVIDGRYDVILDDDEAIYAFTRGLEEDRLLVILNFTGTSPVFALPDDLPAANPELLIANYPVEPAQDIRQLTLKPYEARVYRLR